MSNPTLIKKQYIMTRKVTNVEQFMVDASSKAEAARLIEDECLDYDDISHLHQTIPKFEEYLYTYQCPNIHNGWTEVSSDLKPNDRGWYYNDMCSGEYTDEDAEMCHECAGALAKGHRPLTQDELQYLSDSYGVVIA